MVNPLPAQTSAPSALLNSSTFSVVFSPEGSGFATIIPELAPPNEKVLKEATSSKFCMTKLSGTLFQLSVWKVLTEIPKGRTESYSSLASKIGAPGAARAVGTACKLNPIPLLIPCHRVIKQDGSIGEFALGKANKKYLLKMESK